MIELERLQKVMAESGVASRRKCEQMILDGKVSVNGKVVKELGTKVSKKDKISVNNTTILKEEKVYYVLYKPAGYVTTVKDEHDRKTVLDLILDTDLKTRLFPVGRLDYDTSGVLLLTNDGTLSNQLLNSANHISKTYLARVKGLFGTGHMLKLQKGVDIDGETTKRCKVEIVEVNKDKNSSLVRLTITEGKNRQVRRMFEVLGYEVKKLKREEFAGVDLTELVEGAYRPLRIHEVKHLYNK
ncbi:MAG: pseudouridine synthase [Anaeroplasmataceae bacterium]